MVQLPSNLYLTIFCLFSHKELVTNYGDRGGYKTKGGGHVKFYPYEKGEGGSFSHAEGSGHTKFWGIFYAVA